MRWVHRATFSFVQIFRIWIWIWIFFNRFFNKRFERQKNSFSVKSRRVPLLAVSRYDYLCSSLINQTNHRLFRCSVDLTCHFWLAQVFRIWSWAGFSSTVSWTRDSSDKQIHFRSKTQCYLVSHSEGIIYQDWLDCIGSQVIKANYSSIYDKYRLSFRSFLPKVLVIRTHGPFRNTFTLRKKNASALRGAYVVSLSISPWPLHICLQV